MVIESYFKDQRSNKQRLNSLKTTIHFLSDYGYQNGIIIFPAGMFYTKKIPLHQFNQKSKEKFHHFSCCMEKTLSLFLELMDLRMLMNMLAIRSLLPYITQESSRSEENSIPRKWNGVM